MTAEQVRLDEAREQKAAWKKWGPYLSERQWGTVREDYSENGDAWNFFTHDHARSRAYRWGEDGIAGISDDKQRLCFSLALWNGKDPILKERLFGLTNSEGNHGEDVKEYYFYLDSTPTHSYMKYLYKYPQAAYPYADLVETNRRRARDDMEYELLDTGVFQRRPLFRRVRRVREGRGRRHPRAHHRGQPRTGRGRPASPADAVVPQRLVAVDCRIEPGAREAAPQADRGTGRRDRGRGGASAAGGVRRFMRRRRAAALHRERNQPRAAVRDAERERATSRTASTTAWCTAAQDAVNPEKQGTKVAAHYQVTIGAGQTQRDSPAARPAVSWTRRASRSASRSIEVFADRLREADEFYQAVTPPSVSEDAASVMRQALAGMLWSKQFFFFDGDNWLDEHHSNPLHHGYRSARNSEWFHMLNRRHHLDARQVGVPVVRGLGPGVPHAAALDRRSRLRQGADGADAPRRPTCTRTVRSRPTSGTSAT